VKEGEHEEAAMFLLKVKISPGEYIMDAELRDKEGSTVPHTNVRSPFLFVDTNDDSLTLYSTGASL